MEYPSQLVGRVNVKPNSALRYSIDPAGVVGVGRRLVGCATVAGGLVGWLVAVSTGVWPLSGEQPASPISAAVAIQPKLSQLFVFKTIYLPDGSRQVQPVEAAPTFWVG
jgi:hypothetical protein